MIFSRFRCLSRSARLHLLLFCFTVLSLVCPALADSKSIKVITKKDGDTIHFFVENLEATEITATFELKLENLQASQKLPFTGTYPPHQVTPAFDLTPINRGQTWNYSYTTRYTIGSSVAVHNNSHVYTLPYAPDAAFRVSQGYNGSYSHSGPDQYATDFKMPVGTPIAAVRDGVVVKVKVDSNTGGPDRKYENSANYILIRHADGTLANYAHLRKSGSVVKVGQTVQAGELIGYSGNTGFSSGPHLHFSVFKTQNGSQRQTLPVRFQTADAFAVTLVEGKTYKHSPEVQHKVAASSPKPAFAGAHASTPPYGSPGPKSGVE